MLTKEEVAALSCIETGCAKDALCALDKCACPGVLAAGLRRREEQVEKIEALLAALKMARDERALPLGFGVHDLLDDALALTATEPA